MRVRHVLLAAVTAAALCISMLASGLSSSAGARPTQAQANRALAKFLRVAHIDRPVRVPGAKTTTVHGLNQLSFYNWSGYADDNSGGNSYSRVAAIWTEPKVQCPTNEDEVAVFWVGLDGLSSGSVEQDGTLAYCFEGSAFYYTWWEMYPTNAIQVVGDTVAPSDRITSSVRYVGGNYELDVTDSTNPDNSFSMTEACGSGVTCERSSAEWIAETPSTDRGFYPLPKFTTWKVGSAAVTSGNTKGTISSFPDDEITIVGINGEPLANTGDLNSGGTGFSDTWAYVW